MTPRPIDSAIDPCPELEELAAFVDGRLEGEARRRMVAHLDRCPDCYETFTETVRFQREDERAAGGGEVLTSPRFGGLTRRRVGWVVAAAAALFLLAVVVPLLRTDPARTLFTGPEPEELLLASDDLVAAAGDPVPVRLGPDPLSFSGGMTRERIAFRLGVRLVDLRAAARSGEPEAATGALSQVEALSAHVEGVPLPAGLEDALQEAGRAVGQGDADLLAAATTELEAGFEELFEPFDLAFGKWTEAGRLAAAAGREEYFLSPAFGHFRESLGPRRPLPPPLERQLETIDAATAERPAPPERLAELETAFEALVTLR